jgi:YaiO family outer membrane protein
MWYSKTFFKGLFILLMFFAVAAGKSYAQENLSSDELFQLAKKTASNKNYLKAQEILKKAIIKSPENADMRIFLGRLYTWNNQLDSARAEFKSVLAQSPKNEDAYLAFSSLEYWNANSVKALKIVNNGLKYQPSSSSLLLLRAKILHSSRNFVQANLDVNKVLKLDPKNTEARALSSRITENSSKNRISISYDYFYFDNFRGRAPWNLASFDWSRQTTLGSLTGRVNYANRFNNSGVQFEIDAYPIISKTFYSYLNIGYSKDNNVFPSTKTGFSLFANLPNSFEAEGGFRYLNFSNSIWIYTASVGKYYKNYWFNLRTYLTPDNKNITQAYAITARYYYAGPNDYISFSAGTGISPDANNNVLLNTSTYKLRSNNIGLGIRHTLKATNIIQIAGSFNKQEYLPTIKGNQINLGLSYQKRF